MRWVLPPRVRRSARSHLLLTTIVGLLLGMLALGVQPASAAPAATPATTPSAASDEPEPGILCSLVPELCDPEPEPDPDPDPDPGTDPEPEPDPVEELESDPDAAKLPRGCRDERGYMKPRPCRIGQTKPGAPTIFVYGDSHAGQMLPAVEKAIGNKRINLVLLMLGACPPMLTDAKHPGRGGANVCQDFGNDVAERFRKLQAKGKVFRVVVGMGWQLYHNVLSEPDDVDKAYPTYVNPYIRTNAHRGRTRTPALFEQLGEWGVRVDLIGQLPMVYERAPECEQGEFECDLPRKATLKDAAANRADIQRLRRLVGKSGPLISPAGEFCDRKVCRGTIDGVPTYFDRFHIGRRASVRLASYFKPTVKAVQRADKRARNAAKS